MKLGVNIDHVATLRQARYSDSLDLPQAEPDILAHVNADHADAVAAIATGLCGGAGGAWRLTAVDTDGCDLARGEVVVRHAWPVPVADADGVRRGLIRAAVAGRAARNAAANTNPNK